MGFLTFRRYYLDKILGEIEFSGNVLDVGGVRGNQRGTFRPPIKKVKNWRYLNIDKSTNPDYCCSAENLPIQGKEFDMILMAEVMEHLEKPRVVLKECYRVLKDKGVIVITIPFMYMIHAHPNDYQRWTIEGIRREMDSSGFVVQTIQPMGSLFAVVYDIIRGGLGVASKNRKTLRNRIINRLFLPLFFKLFLLLDKKYEYKNSWITTGYCVVGKKE